DPSGKRVALGGEGTVETLPSPTGWVGKACSQLTRNLGPEEWDDYVGKDIAYIVQCPGLYVPGRGEFTNYARPARCRGPASSVIAFKARTGSRNAPAGAADRRSRRGAECTGRPAARARSRRSPPAGRTRAAHAARPVRAA